VRQLSFLFSTAGRAVPHLSPGGKKNPFPIHLLRRLQRLNGHIYTHPTLDPGLRLAIGCRIGLSVSLPIVTFIFTVGLECNSAEITGSAVVYRAVSQLAHCTAPLCMLSFSRSTVWQSPPRVSTQPSHKHCNIFFGKVSINNMSSVCLH